MENKVELKSVGIEISVGEIYERVEFGAGT
jgi:hypothetical protein